MSERWQVDDKGCGLVWAHPVDSGEWSGHWFTTEEVQALASALAAHLGQELVPIGAEVALRALVDEWRKLANRAALATFTMEGRFYHAGECASLRQCAHDLEVLMGDAVAPAQAAADAVSALTEEGE